jgi:hypothetical protein
LVVGIIVIIVSALAVSVLPGTARAIGRARDDALFAMARASQPWWLVPTGMARAAPATASEMVNHRKPQA